MREWSRRDQQLAMGLIDLEDLTCPGCGQPLHESTDPDGPDYSVEDNHCRACEMLHDAGSENDKPGTQWYLHVERRGSAEGAGDR